ncbi:hypothetical protein N7517_001046 [Penicillium concentricum]|uniref:Inositolphosphotransferase Aur1/Ipt1 domain-containing protein n=1 Tax=Penicillium concentricum TaxID=293559 RepID=A0A9W9SRB6_9EURO|nr:uncharacterized protein N7517_001046 [Penicillium concentricum]KAJ5383135.1 hypothetical protein N7517_001046 [Penicillium concentricum]
MATLFIRDAETPDLGKPQLASHAWLEPIVVVGIMVGSLIVNRRRDSSSSRTEYTLLEEGNAHFNDANLANNMQTKSETVCGINIKNRDSSRWAQHIHSKILQKLPFLVEMFYWSMNYLFYSVTKATAQWLSPADIGVVAVARGHAIDVLDFEHKTASWIFPINEADFQSFFIQNHPSILTMFNRIYSLIHIPGTVLFLSWYYYVAKNHASFALARRTMTLGNLAAFLVFCIYPLMPPRLLPDSYGFYDTVRQGNAESIWVGGKSVNQFAAMPSLHFTYAFVIGCTFLHHSGFLQRLQRKPTQKSRLTEFGFLALAICYPILVLSVIVATANHYWLDAVVAIFTVTLSYRFNRVLILLLPLEYALCWCLRLAKPVPTTGDKASRK